MSERESEIGLLPSISVSNFIDPAPRSREHNAICRAIDLAPNVEPIGEIRGERYYRVRAKGRDRHCVIRWFSQLSNEEVAKCDCESFYVPQEPQPCFHVGAVLIYEATHAERKQASMKNQTKPERAPLPRVDEVPMGSFYCKGCKRIVRNRHRCPGPRRGGGRVNVRTSTRT